MTGNKTDIKTAMEENARDVTRALDHLLPIDGTLPESKLEEAMRYAVLDGGKRVRPFLVMASAELFNVREEAALRVAAAVEMVHGYSLVHDDLPCMDDDALRRGKPTCHIQFGEAAAVLAGDALLTRAFEVLSEDETHPDAGVRANLILELARAIGAEGMAGGQMLDLMAEEKTLTMAEVTRLQRMKTGALISFSCEAGAILARAPETSHHALHAYAHDLGLAFQIIDDLLDVEGTPETVGKATRKDEKRGKSTFISLLGVDRARDQATMLADQARHHLEIFDEKADPLREFSHFVVDRQH